MKFQDFENIMSPARMSRYLTACGGNSKKAMTLYRFNLRASQEFFTVISCFEVSLVFIYKKIVILSKHKNNNLYYLFLNYKV